MLQGTLVLELTLILELEGIFCVQHLSEHDPNVERIVAVGQIARIERYHLNPGLPRQGSVRQQFHQVEADDVALGG